jgi:hypothetical protein
VELWLRLTEVSKAKQGAVLDGCLSREPIEFAKTISDELVFTRTSPERRFNFRAIYKNDPDKSGYYGNDPDNFFITKMTSAFFAPLC